MDNWFIFNLIAGIASIGGAIFSFWQAKDSQSAAKRAQAVKDQIIANQRTSDMSELFSACRKAQRSMEKFGPGAWGATLRGITPYKETQDVQEFYALLKQNRGLFGNSEPNQADKHCDRLSSALEEFTHSQNDDEMCQYGKNLYIILVEISPEIKMLMNEKIERTT